MGAYSETRPGSACHQCSEPWRHHVTNRNSALHTLVLTSRCRCCASFRNTWAVTDPAGVVCLSSCGPSPDHLHVYHYHLLPYKYGTANPQRSFIPRLLSSITLGHSCICIHSRPSFQRGPYHQHEDQHLRPWFSYLNTTQTHQLSSPLSVVTNSSRFLYTNNRLSINLYSPLPQPT
jgi:hypothetical protein